MRIAEVIGTVVATEKHPDFHAKALMICQPLDAEGAKDGPTILAVDTVQAGVGDRVLLMREGNSVRQIFGAKKMCIRSAIVGVIDSVDIAPAPGSAAANAANAAANASDSSDQPG